MTAISPLERAARAIAYVSSDHKHTETQWWKSLTQDEKAHAIDMAKAAAKHLHPLQFDRVDVSIVARALEALRYKQTGNVDKARIYVRARREDFIALPLTGALSAVHLKATRRQIENHGGSATDFDLALLEAML